MAFRLGEGFIDLTVRRGGFNRSMSIVASSLSGLNSIIGRVVSGVQRIVSTVLMTAMRTITYVVGRLISLFKKLGLITLAYAGLSIKAYGSFERAMRRATAVSDVTTEQFERMTRMAEEQSVRLNMAATKTADAFYFLGSAGLNATQQMQAFIPVATLAKAATMEMGETAEMVVDTMKGFHIGFEHTTHVTDVMAKAVISSNQKFNQLGESLSLVSGLARTTNNSLEETVTLISAMADVGIKGSRAGVYLRRGLINLMAPMSALRDLLDKYNLKIYDSSGEMKSFLTIVQEVSQALAGASKEQRNLMFKTMFGQRAIAGQIAIFDKGAAALRKFANELYRAGGTAEEIAGKQMVAFDERIGQMWRRIKVLSRTVGAIFAPAILRLAASIGEATARLTEYLRAHLPAMQEWAERVAMRIEVVAGAFWKLAKYIYSDWRITIQFGLESVLRIFIAVANSLDYIWQRSTQQMVITWDKALNQMRIKFQDFAIWWLEQIPTFVIPDPARGMMFAQMREIKRLYEGRIFGKPAMTTAKLTGLIVNEFKAAARDIATNVPEGIIEIFTDAAARIAELDREIMRRGGRGVLGGGPRTAGVGGGVPGGGAGMPAFAGAGGGIGFVGLADAWKTMSRAFAEQAQDAATETTQKQSLDVQKQHLRATKSHYSRWAQYHDEQIAALNKAGAAGP